MELQALHHDEFVALLNAEIHRWNQRACRVGSSGDLSRDLERTFPDHHEYLAAKARLEAFDRRRHLDNPTRFISENITPT